MKERGILFSQKMVEAILAGRKRMTRRLFDTKSGKPYAATGDTLWVRETFYAYGQWERNTDENGKQIWHFNDMTEGAYYHFDTKPRGTRSNRVENVLCWYKRPALFMPRAASRITLRVSDVKQERLSEITNEDAEAEGCDLEWYRDNAGSAELWPCHRCKGFQVYTRNSLGGASEVDCMVCATPKGMFMELWKSLHGEHSVDKDPTLNAISFNRV